MPWVLFPSITCRSSHQRAWRWVSSQNCTTSFIVEDSRQSWLVRDTVESEAKHCPLILPSSQCLPLMPAPYNHWASFTTSRRLSANDQTACSLFWLVSFTLNNAFETHPYCSMCHLVFLYFNGWIVLASQWASELFLIIINKASLNVQMQLVWTYIFTSLR